VSPRLAFLFAAFPNPEEQGHGREHEQRRLPQVVAEEQLLDAKMQEGREPRQRRGDAKAQGGGGGPGPEQDPPHDQEKVR
jgi:hypothetical protein